MGIEKINFKFEECAETYINYKFTYINYKLI